MKEIEVFFNDERHKCVKRYFKKGIFFSYVILVVLLSSINAFAWDGLQMDVLDVGQGLSVLISCGDHYALYDGGGRDSSSYVVSYLQQHGVTHLDYLISSHYDEDHLAGLVGVLYAAECDQVLCADYAADTAIYSSFQEAVSQEGLTEIHPTAGDVYYMGDAVIDIVGPIKNLESVNATDSRFSDDENDSCVSIRVSYGDNAFLMCGDAQAVEEKAMLASGENLSADVYVVSHHGSSSSSTEEFLSAVSPASAVISCGRGNAYGHPAQEVLDRLEAQGCSIFRTDLQGEITAQADGENVYFNQDPTDDLTPGTYISESKEEDKEEKAPSFNETDTAYEPDSAGAQGEAGNKSSRPGYSYSIGEAGFDAGALENTDTGTGNTGYIYICNKNTGVFHDPDCRSVGQMKEENKIYSSQSREELIAEGYKPCGNCRP